MLGVALLVPAGLTQLTELTELTATTAPTVTVAGLLWAAVIGAVTTALSYVAWYACRRRMSATTAGSVQLAIPVLTAAGAMVLLGERLTLLFVVAAVLVVGGLWVGRPR